MLKQVQKVDYILKCIQDFLLDVNTPSPPGLQPKLKVSSDLWGGQSHHNYEAENQIFTDEILCHLNDS